MSAIVTDPVRVPSALGVNVTLAVQLVFGERVTPQLFDCEKSPAAETEEIERLDDPVFVSVTVCGELVVATDWVEKLRVEVDSVIITF